MTTLLDTTVLIDILRDKTKRASDRLATVVGEDDIYVSRHSEFELLTGARDNTDWLAISAFLAKMAFVDHGPSHWRDAARIHYDLRRRGLTIRNRTDCLIAQAAIEREFLLLHNDRDFETITNVRSLRQRRLDLTQGHS